MTLMREHRWQRPSNERDGHGQCVPRQGFALHPTFLPYGVRLTLHSPPAGRANRPTYLVRRTKGTILD